MAYVKKDEAWLRWDEMKKRLRLEGRVVLDRVLNEVLDEADKEFTAAETTGQLMDIPDSRAELQAYFRRAAERVLTSGGQRALAPKR